MSANGLLVSQRWQSGDGPDRPGRGPYPGGTVIYETLGWADGRFGAPQGVHGAAGQVIEAWVAGHHYTCDFTLPAPSACLAGTRATARLIAERVRLLDETFPDVADTGYRYDAADRLVGAGGDRGQQCPRRR